MLTSVRHPRRRLQADPRDPPRRPQKDPKMAPTRRPDGPPEAGGLREAKEMIISNRIVGPEHLRTPERSDPSCKGGGVRGGGKAFGVAARPARSGLREAIET